MRIMITVDRVMINRVIAAYKQAHRKKPTESWLRNFLKNDVSYIYEWHHEFGDDAKSQLQDAVENF